MTGVSGAAAFAHDRGSVAPRAAEAPNAAEVSSGSELTGLALAARVARVDASALDDHALLEHLADCEKVASWFASLGLTAAAEFARRPARIETAGDDPAAVRAQYAKPGQWCREFADAEVAARLRISSAAAGARIRLGCALATMPLAKASLDTGRIDVYKAKVLVAETAVLDSFTARELEPALVALAETSPGPRLRPRVRAVVMDADPVAAQGRYEAAKAERRVVITPAADGMAELYALLPAGVAMTIRESISAAARASKTDAAPDDARTMDQRRADALAAPFVEALATGWLRPIVERSPGNPDRRDEVGQRSAGDGAWRLGRRRGQPVELQVTVAASTLLGHDDAAAQLRGYGPITAEASRELAPDARWRRLLTDPVSGAVLDVGTTVYRPPAQIARYVVARDVLCTFPGCGAQALNCEPDHAVPFPAGSTSVANLGSKCVRHHHAKHSTGFHFEQDVDGSGCWITPTGHVYDVNPPEVGRPIAGPGGVEPDPDAEATFPVEQLEACLDRAPPDDGLD